jgi:hypothetical protein
MRSLRLRSGQALRSAQDDRTKEFELNRSFLKSEDRTVSLAFPSSENVENERQHDAEDDRSGEREIERGVLATINDVTGQMTQRQVHAAEEGETESGYEEDCAENNEKLA